MTKQPTSNTLTLSELARQIDARLIGDGAVQICGVNTIKAAGESEMCFLSSRKFIDQLADTKAAAVLVAGAIDGCNLVQLVVDNVDRALIAALTIFAPKLTALEGVHSTAVIEADVQLDPTVVVGPHAYIARGVSVGAQTVIGPGCSIGEGTTIAAGCRFESHVVIYHGCQIGNGCIIGANSTIGATGFGYCFLDGQHRLVPHNGGVILEDGVEIGANSCIDRAKFGNTVIGAGTKIDNLVQVAHNVQIGKCCLLAGHVGIAGSTQVGNGVVFAGAAGASDNLKIGDGAILAKQTAASKDVPAGKTMLGVIPQEMSKELRSMSVYQRLPELAKELKQLHKKVAKLEAAKDD